MAANPRDILLRPIITEKTSVMLQDNKYTFQVPLTANKVEIRQAVEQIFKVKVLNVNTVRVFGNHAEQYASLFPFPIYPMNYVSNEKELVDIYNAVDLYVTPSLQDKDRKSVV